MCSSHQDSSNDSGKRSVKELTYALFASMKLTRGKKSINMRIAFVLGISINIFTVKKTNSEMSRKQYTSLNFLGSL